MKILCLLSLILVSVNIAACNADQNATPEPESVSIPPADSLELPQTQTDLVVGITTKIKVTIGGQVLNGTLNDNPTTRDFISLLPLTLALTDYSNFEKISVLSRPLTTSGAPSGSTPSAGNVAFYAPWGNLALFHRDFSYSPGLVIMGKFDSNITILRTPGTMSARIELVSTN